MCVHIVGYNQEIVKHLCQVHLLKVVFSTNHKVTLICDSSNHFMVHNEYICACYVMLSQYTLG